MTADDAGTRATEGIWATLKRLKEHWVLVVFLIGAVVSARDVIDRYAPLPTLVGGLARQVEAMAASVARLDQAWADRTDGARAPVLGFPGGRHGADDAAPGQWTQVRLTPVRALRRDCKPGGVWGHMVDSAGQWFAVDTELALMPSLEGDTDLAFGVRVHPRMARGRARLAVQMTHDCGTHQQVDTAPWLHFTVTGG